MDGNEWDNQDQFSLVAHLWARFSYLLIVLEKIYFLLFRNSRSYWEQWLTILIVLP